MLTDGINATKNTYLSGNGWSRYRGPHFSTPVLQRTSGDRHPRITQF